MIDRLLRCPFCGGEAELKHNILWDWIQCKNCGAMIQERHCKETAIKAWNIRKPTEQIVEQLEKYRAFEDNDSIDRQIIDRCIEIVKKGGKE